MNEHIPYTTPFPLGAGESHVTLIFDGDCVCCLWSCLTGREPVHAYVRVPAVCLVCEHKKETCGLDICFCLAEAEGRMRSSLINLSLLHMRS